MSRVLFFFLALSAAARASATEPLFDRYADGARSGRIFPSQCCYLQLPDNKRIWDIRKKEMQMCSAVGGPVGSFRLEAGKLWLTGLLNCGGEVALQEVYPGMKGPAVADWLTGTFKSVLDYQCVDAAGHQVYAVTQQLIVDKGVVRSVAETPNDSTACAK